MSKRLKNLLIGFLAGVVAASLGMWLFIRADSRRLERAQQELRQEIIAMTGIVVEIADIVQDYELAIRWNAENILQSPGDRALGEREEK